MESCCGIDVSLEQSFICVVNTEGSIVREATVASDPNALIAWFSDLKSAAFQDRLGGQSAAAVAVCRPGQGHFCRRVARDTSCARCFKAMPIETDRKDARGIAQLMRLGWYQAVPCTSRPAQEVRAVLTAPKLVQVKLHDVEMSLRGTLCG